MGRQSARIYFQGRDHKEIYFNGHYHDKMYLTDSEGNATLVWEKLRTEEGVGFTPWGIAYREGTYYVLQKDMSSQMIRNETGSLVSVISLKIYTGKKLAGLKLRHTEYYLRAAGDSMQYLYFIDCSEYGLEYAFGTHPDARGAFTTGSGVSSVYRRIPDADAADYSAQFTNVPARIIQCGSFGVVFDAEGNYYWCSSSSYYSSQLAVEFYRSRNMDDFTKQYQQIGGVHTRFASCRLSVSCVHSFAFLVEDRITVCCLPHDTGYYTYAEVLEKPFYICSVAAGGDGSDIRAEDLKNKGMVYTNAALKYFPMRLSTNGAGSRPDMIGRTKGYIAVDGTSRKLVIDFASCEIVSVDTYESIVCICRSDNPVYLMTRRYEEGMNSYSLYYGVNPDGQRLQECRINTDGSTALYDKAQYNISYVYFADGSLHMKPVRGLQENAVIRIELASGDYEETELTAKSI